LKHLESQQPVVESPPEGPSGLHGRCAAR